MTALQLMCNSAAIHEAAGFLHEKLKAFDFWKTSLFLLLLASLF